MEAYREDVCRENPTMLHFWNVAIDTNHNNRMFNPISIGKLNIINSFVPNTWQQKLHYYRSYHYFEWMILVSIACYSKIYFKLCSYLQTIRPPDHQTVRPPDLQTSRPSDLQTSFFQHSYPDFPLKTNEL